MRLLVETKFGVLPLPIGVASLDTEQVALLEKNLEEAFLFLTKDKAQKDINPDELVSVMCGATDRFLTKQAKKKSMADRPALLVPTHLINR